MGECRRGFWGFVGRALEMDVVEMRSSGGLGERKGVGAWRGTQGAGGDELGWVGEGALGGGAEVGRGSEWGLWTGGPDEVSDPTAIGGRWSARSHDALPTTPRGAQS